MSELQMSKPKSCPVLKQGSKGDWVVCLQNALNRLGYGPLKSDGNFGPKTTDVVKKFQKNFDLQADGTVGEKTWLALDKLATSQGWELSWPTTQTDTDTPLGRPNQAILTAALNLRGMSTAKGPGGGNQACAWMLNRVLEKAGIPTLGENPNLVTSLVEALKGGRGQRVSKAEALAGDLVVAYGEDHIGVGLDDGCKRVLSNSSSRASFRWESNTDFDGYYGGSSTIYRLLK
ncbi:MAG TPA: hypothetical protein DCE56_06995 [Cyanobacteria bacterium UBA8553]|nr:hypothetical protein [Cyanobacteria bacterium UBA8553]